MKNFAFVIFSALLIVSCQAADNPQHDSDYDDPIEDILSFKLELPQGFQWKADDKVGLFDAAGGTCVAEISGMNGKTASFTATLSENAPYAAALPSTVKYNFQYKEFEAGVPSTQSAMKNSYDRNSTALVGIGENKNIVMKPLVAFYYFALTGSSEKIAKVSKIRLCTEIDQSEQYISGKSDVRMLESGPGISSQHDAGTSHVELSGNFEAASYAFVGYPGTFNLSHYEVTYNDGRTVRIYFKDNATIIGNPGMAASLNGIDIDTEQCVDPVTPPEPDPVIDPVPPGPEDEYDGYRWAELPKIGDANNDGHDDLNPDYYYAYHILTDLKNDKGQNARNYSVCFSAKNHCAMWVAAPMHSFYKKGKYNSRNYSADPDIPYGIQYNSGSNSNTKFNKGHLLSRSDRSASSQAQKQTAYFTNIAPQLAATFNTGGGAWNNLESWVTGRFCSDTLYAVIGAYYDDYKDQYGQTCNASRINFCGTNDVGYPTMFYYALLRTKSGNTGKYVADCSADQLICVAIPFRHNMEKGHDICEKDLISISDLEKITGFTYFPNVPNAPKDTFKASDWGF